MAIILCLLPARSLSTISVARHSVYSLFSPFFYFSLPFPFLFSWFIMGELGIMASYIDGAGFCASRDRV